MPSRFAQLYAAHAVPTFVEHLAERDETTGEGQVVRYPLGNQNAPQLVVGIWCEEDAHDGTERGHENVRKVWLTIFDQTIPLDARDTYCLMSVFANRAAALSQRPPQDAVWKTRSISFGTEPANVVELERRDRELGNGRGGKVL